MKKLFIFLILLPNIVFAMSISEFIGTMSNNPDQYTIVIPETISQVEAQELLAFTKQTGVIKNNIPDEIFGRSNLIIYGGDNPITSEYVGDLSEDQGIIKVDDSNLIIAGGTISKNLEMIKILQEYGQNTDKLKNSEYTVGKAIISNQEILDQEHNSPINYTWGIVLGAIALFGILGIIITRKEDPNISKLKEYVQITLSKGYNKQQIYTVLRKSGWNENIVRKVLKN